MRAIKRVFIPLLIIGAAIAIFVFMKSTKPAQPPVEIKEKAWVVEAYEVKAERLASVQSLFGTVESNALVTASAPLNGEVAEVWVLPGDVIKKGQKLIALNQQDIEIPLQQAKSALIEAEAQLGLLQLANQANRQKLVHERKVLELKRGQIERTQQLLKKNLASQTALDSVKEAALKQEFSVVTVELAVKENDLRVRQAQASLDKARANYQQAQLNAERGIVVAPFDGRVAAVMVAAGDRVAPNTPMLSFYSTDSLELKVKLPVEQLSKLQSAMNQAETESLFAKVSEGGQAHRLPLLRLAGQASTSGVETYFKIPTTLAYKRPGELLQIDFQSQPMDDVWALPYRALYGKDRIYLIEEGRLKGQTVQVVGEVQRDGKLCALLKAPMKEATVSVTHLPNAVSGLKVIEESL